MHTTRRPSLLLVTGLLLMTTPWVVVAQEEASTLPAVELDASAQLADFVSATWDLLTALLTTTPETPASIDQVADVENSDLALASFERLLASEPQTPHAAADQIVDADGLNARGFNPEASDPSGVFMILTSDLDSDADPCLHITAGKANPDGTIDMWSVAVRGIGPDSGVTVGLGDPFTYSHAERFQEWAAAHDYPCGTIGDASDLPAALAKRIQSIHCFRINSSRQVCIATFDDGTTYSVMWCRTNGTWNRCATAGSP
jgi:hypothetical protein